MNKWKATDIETGRESIRSINKGDTSTTTEVETLLSSSRIYEQGCDGKNASAAKKEFCQLRGIVY